MKVLEKTVTEELERTESVFAKKRILIVDDDPSYAKMVREWIKEKIP